MIFILACLAVWRICNFIAHDEGPWQFMAEIRQRAYDNKHYSLYEWMTCVKCSSVWIAFPFAAFIAPFGWLIVTWLALSAVVILLEAVYGMLWKG